MTYEEKNFVIPEEFHSQFKDHISDGLSFLNINVRNINKNFKVFFFSWGLTFSVICFFWRYGLMKQQVLINRYMNYQTIQVFIKWGNKEEGGVSLYIPQSIEFKIGNCFEHKFWWCEIHFSRNSFRKQKECNSNRRCHAAGDFNINVLDNEIWEKVQEFLNIIYENGIMPNINKPTRVTNKKATAIEHILINSYTETIFKTATFKCNISDHFPVRLTILYLRFLSNKKDIFFYKRSFTEQSITNFRKNLFEID